MGTAAAIIVGGASLAGSIYGSKKQSEGIKRGQDIQSRYYQELLDFQKQVYGESEPFRDIALNRAELIESLMPDLTAKLLKPAGSTVSERYKLAGREGMDLIRSNFATSGSPSSGPAQIAAGRFMEGLSAAEADRLINQENINTSNLLGFTSGVPSPTTGVAESANLLGAAGGPAGNLSNLAVSQGAVTGGLYGSIGSDLSQMAMIYAMGGFGGGGGGGTNLQMSDWS
jgi:hypothetical protein